MRSLRDFGQIVAVVARSLSCRWPRETWLRLLVIRDGFPRPQTQIRVLVAVLDYEGGHHRDSVRFNKDVRRHDDVPELGWMDIRATSRDTAGGIIARLTAEWSRRT